MTFTHRYKATNPLTLEDRIKIKKLLDDGYGYKRIGDAIGRVKSTIGYELHRFATREDYDPHLAHEDFLEKQKNMK